MRKVLLRIMFDRLWQVDSVGNELHVGYGWMLAVWGLIAVVSLSLLWKITKDSKQLISSLPFWALIPTVVALIPVLGLPFAAGGIPVFGYGFMLFVGFSTATWLAARRAQSVELNPEVIWDLMMWVLIPGILGARIVYLMQYGDRVFAGKQGLSILKAAVALWDGGIVFYGGIIGGVVGLLVYCRRRKIRPLQLADVLMPSVFVGLGFGRIGCFLYGCCFGAACSLPWAVHFPQDSMTFEALAVRSEKLVESGAGDEARLLEANGVPVTAAELREQDSAAVLTTIALHPTQMYSSVLAFSLAGLLMWLFPRRPFEGAVLATGWILYPVNRFILEIVRDDEPGRLNTGLTFSQLVSIGLFVSGCVLMIWLQKKNHPVPKQATTLRNSSESG
ncbi:MAG: prolipoprotein diacylglyceryl transferase [Fuerstiella sp.]